LLLITTMTAGYQKIFSDNAKIGFLALANKYEAAIAKGTVIAPAKSLEQMGQLVFNNQLNATLCGLCMLIVLSLAGFAWREIRQARATQTVTAQESDYVSFDSQSAISH
jgi:carbon starvation protein